MTYFQLLASGSLILKTCPDSISPPELLHNLAAGHIIALP